MRISLRTALLLAPLGLVAACAQVIGADFGDYTLTGSGGKGGQPSATGSTGGSVSVASSGGGAATASSASSTGAGAASSSSTATSTTSSTSASSSSASSATASTSSSTSATVTSSSSSSSSSASSTGTSSSSTSASTTSSTSSSSSSASSTAASSSASSSSSSSTGGPTACTIDADCPVQGEFCWLGACAKLTAISAGGQAPCALTTTGAVQCWGANGSGQLGNDSTTDSSVPVPVSGLSSGVTAIVAGSSFACALTKGGAVQCWGDNALDELGNNSTTNSPVPVPVSGLSSGVTAIAAGSGHACALKSGGGVVCWGYNFYGQLGDGSTTNSPVPVAVSGLSGVRAIAAGVNDTCALKSGGGVVCWGWGTDGALEGAANSSTPVAMSGFSGGVSAVGVGYAEACVLTTAGGVQCWGADMFGELGNNTGMADSTVPVAVSGLSSGVASISAGSNYVCALTTGGGVSCWGEGDMGELGDDSTMFSHVPVAVTGLSSGVASVSAGFDHTCAITTAGGAMCWGTNSHGQLGDNSTTNSLVPVSVVEP